MLDKLYRCGTQNWHLFSHTCLSHRGTVFLLRIKIVQHHQKMLCWTNEYCFYKCHESASYDHRDWGYFWKACYKFHKQCFVRSQDQDASASHVSWHCPCVVFVFDKKDKERCCLARLGDTPPARRSSHLQNWEIRSAWLRNVYFQGKAVDTFIISGFLCVFFRWLYSAVFLPKVMSHSSHV